MWILPASFVGIFLLVIGVYWLLVLRPEGALGRSLGRRLKPREPRARNTNLVNVEQRRSTLPYLDRLLHGFPLVFEPCERLLEHSGLRLTLGRFVLASVFLALLVLSLGLQAGGGLLLALPAAALGGSVPYLVVQRVAQRRIARFEEQFPEAIALIARALRAGHALPTGLGLVTEEVPEPVRGEFKLLYDRQNYGMPLPDALRAFAERVPLIDARFFATAVLTQREAGGNLAEVLDGLAAIIRDRFRLKRQVRVVSAHGRITGVVLGLMPLAIGAVLFVISPGHITRLLDDPVGLKLVIGAGMLQLIGFIVIRRIVQIEV